MVKALVFSLSVAGLLASALALFELSPASADNPLKVNILWANFSRPHSLNLVAQELAKPVRAKSGARTMPGADVKIIEAPIPTTAKYTGPNPFFAHPRDFYVGLYLPYEGDTQEPPPMVSPLDAGWFDTLLNLGGMDVFVIAGHQVISEGWHDHPERKFLFLPTLLDTLARYPGARKAFNQVKLAVLWGCNTMTNLEPHGPHGEYLSPEQIKKLYDSGPTGKRAVLGSADEVNTLEFYRARLAREYGPSNKEHYEYTRGPKNEKCAGPGKYENCDIANVDRLFPDSGLWDGTHRYNYPYMMKRIFPNANLVLGYSSASPDEETRVLILDAALKKATGEINAALAANPATQGKRINNILLPLVDPSAPAELKRLVIEAIRKNWTIATYKMNRERPSGSITPVFHDLEKNNILGASYEHGSRQYGQYESN